MEDRLAEVQALVEKRWERARAKQQQNGALGRRKDALVAEIKALVTSTRSVNEAEAAELEARILRVERQVEMRRRGVTSRRIEVARERSRRLAMDAQIKQLQVTIASERKENARFFGQVAYDKRALDEMDKQRRDNERVALEELRRALLHEHSSVQEQVAAAQHNVRNNGNSIRALEEERRALDRELREATLRNCSLKKRVAEERQQAREMTEAARKQTARVLEERANSILKELDALRA